MKYFNIALFCNAFSIFLYLLMEHKAPWGLVALYWGINSAKSLIPCLKER